jgi:steroid 5-alpha reductase family enzyme
VSRAASLVRIVLGYVVAVGVGAAWLFAGPDTDRLWLDALVADLLATVVIFGFSRLHKNSSFYDAYWSVLPPLIALWWWVEGGPGADDPRAWLVTTVTWVWAIRLTGNWLYSWPGIHHEDWRYPLLKKGAGRAELVVDLVAIHVIPTLVVFLGLVPAYVAISVQEREVFWLDYLALAVGLGAVALEFFADLQMHRFVRSREPGQVMDMGLWGWSRHPNYVGEVAFWLSLALFGVAASPDDTWWLFVGVVAMFAMFWFASIPMMEKRSLERRPDYQRVVETVPAFFPRPPRRRRTAEASG